MVQSTANGPAARGSATHIISIVARLEAVLGEARSELRQRRIKNLLAEAKFRGIPLPALRALIAGRNRLRLARAAIEKLPPHRRRELSDLAAAIGETADIFQFRPATSDSALKVLSA